MTRIVIIVVTAIVAFGGGFLGMVLTMPSVNPDKVALVDSVQASGPVDVDLSTLPEPADPDSLEAPTPENMLPALEDSLSAARSEIAELTAELTALREDREIRESRAQRLAALSATLPKLEVDELSAILERLEMSTLEQLYHASTARSRTTILQALSSERAAQFVQRMVDPSLQPLNTPTEP